MKNIFKWVKSLNPKQSVGTKVILSIILVSSLVTFIATAVQLYIEYKRDINILYERIDQVKSGYLKSITNSMWAVDMEQLSLLLDGIYRLPDIERVEVEKKGLPYFGIGEIPVKLKRKYSFPITYLYDDNNINLGSLNLYVSLDGVYQRLFNRVAVILSSQAVKTFIVSLFALAIFQFFVTRHLKTISDSVRKFKFDKNDEDIILERKKLTKSTDEFDDLTSAFNKLRKSLKKSYNELQRSEERFDLAMQGANDGLWDWSVEKQEIYYSDRYKQILGYSEDELKGSYGEWSSRIHPDDRKSTLSKLGRALSSLDDQFIHTYRLKAKDDNYRWVLSRGIVVKNVNDKPSRMVGTIMDITERKIAEEQLASTLSKLEKEQSKRIMAERLACVGELSASIAHEIRNPLCSILGAVEHLSDDGLNKNHRKEMYTILNQEAKRLNRVLTDFLQFSKQRDPNIIEVDIIPIVRDTTKVIKLDYDVSHIGFKEHFDVQHIQALCDPDLIRQVLWNLLKNSIESVNAHGEIEVSVCLEEKSCIVRVKDSGKGIQKKKIDLVSQPFFTSKKEGTGLGLAITTKILSAHDSELIIDSEEGKGTEASFKLRVNQAWD